MDAQPTLPIFFIIGRPRSGTTLLRMLFEAHPQVIIPPESPFIVFLYKKYGRVNHWDENTITAFCDDVMAQRYFSKWLIEREILLKWLLQEKGIHTYQHMVKKVCLAYQSVYPKSDVVLIGDKNPAYALYINRVHQIFPEAKIIYITRDYRDNYLSLTRVNFEVPIVPLVVYRWKFALKLALKLKKKNPECLYMLRYEDLAKNPEPQLRAMCNFLNLPFDASVLSFYEKKAVVEQAYGDSEEIKTIHRSLLKPISTDRLNRWKEEMTAKQIKLADLVAGKMADKVGYQREYPHFNLWLYVKLSPLLLYANLMYRALLLGSRLPWRWQQPLNRFLGIFLKTYWKFNQRKVQALK
ncbi:MAG: sulfotransferase [Lentimicrobium sp.]|jgi:hypothetical protein|nr:sulfotransferase [Lentimicrobium sp.]MDD2529216.1 sulfotransferase [Lentimicrobiaceae bacterium]MDD4596668.1 sulfotransferase [Lentimicrobiaceae bacterium]MDY0027279.1 sulfotransferase [Lentimicrobium sp.]